VGHVSRLGARLGAFSTLYALLISEIVEPASDQKGNISERKRLIRSRGSSALDYFMLTAVTGIRSVSRYCRKKKKNYYLDAKQ